MLSRPTRPGNPKEVAGDGEREFSCTHISMFAVHGVSTYSVFTSGMIKYIMLLHSSSIPSAYVTSEYREINNYKYSLCIIIHPMY